MCETPAARNPASLKTRPLYTNRTFRGVAGIRRSLKNRCWSHGAGAQGLNNIRRSGRWGAEQSSEDNNYVIVQNTAALHEPYVERFPFRVSYIQAFYGAARRSVPPVATRAGGAAARLGAAGPVAGGGGRNRLRKYNGGCTSEFETQ